MTMRGRRMPLMRLVCFSEVSPRTHEVVERDVVLVAGLAVGQRRVAHGRRREDHHPLARVLAMPGSSSTGPRTIHAPVAPDATWIAVLPWMWGWYQNRPSW
jgi:hypothetical protein